MDWIFAFGTGLFAGLICMGGLGYGLKILMEISSQDEGQKNQEKDKKRAIFAGILLIGQFLASAGIIYASRWVRVYPVMTGFGLLLAIAIGFIFLQQKAPPKNP